ncbi:MAG: hypothetical protein AAB784_03045 [Patescibacteria group bacterium]
MERKDVFKLSIQELLKRARMVKMTPEEIREQVISFAYGNAAIENPSVIREMFEREYDELVEKGLIQP